MSESSLSYQLSDLAAAVGSYLGFARTASSWTGWDALNPYVPKDFILPAINQTIGAQDSQLGNIMTAVQAGYRSFLFPKLADQGPLAHRWSFLTQQRQLVTVANQGVYDLPDDFSGVEGEMTYPSTDGTWLTVKRVGIGQISRYLEYFQNAFARPVCCAAYTKPTDGSAPQRWALAFAPVPDQAYTLTYTSRIFPVALSAANPWPVGGMLHGETIKQACLAVAETDYNDEPDGPHRREYMERLQASIAADVRDFRPEYFGQNTDRSDEQDGGWSPWNYRNNPAPAAVLYNGQPLG